MDAPHHAPTPSESSSAATPAPSGGLTARPGPALLALAIGAFAIGSTEFLMMGLLPQVASDLQVSVPAVGYAISAYALGVVAGAPTLTALSTRYPHQRVLAGLMVLFVLGHVVTAVAPGYDGLIVGRFVTGLSHGSFFGVAAVVATRLAAPGKAASAIGRVFTGLTAAQVLGVPVGTLLGQQLGWRWAFATIGLLGVATVIAVLRWVPLRRDTATPLRQEMADLVRPQVLLTLAATAIGTGGLFAVYSYVAPILTDLAGFSAGAVAWVLVVYGCGTVAGTLLGGRAADRFPEGSVVLGLLGLGLACLLLLALSGSKAGALVALVIFAVIAFFVGPTLINRTIAVAPGSGLMASAFNQAAFNAANALGAAAGAQVLTAGFGLRATMVVGAGLAVSGSAVALVAVLLQRRASQRAASGGSSGSVTGRHHEVEHEPSLVLEALRLAGEAGATSCVAAVRLTDRDPRA
ncbi:MFS transporter, DHA1 family, inner membrane transport protein [Quadrisphaera granulorum]|uniref:DHA1 family inner membrane transport protein n=1 Tax=Quadrisphaera granulorum TaxID=317664 RepID=A0A316ACF6_9ACTN|nr:MFS transporter [Quadrisphaera granulorum]PWJ54650.1 DHA1 family inner membrane transport protein [Quadrisphaera granulorum]SZE96012.1 MFS transporter, DHA1 family, inner membrane transport protein [Quadrisphaera granulorum]